MQTPPSANLVALVLLSSSPCNRSSLREALTSTLTTVYILLLGLINSLVKL